MTKNVLPPLEEWSFKGDESYGCAEPSYSFGKRLNDDFFISADIKRTCFILRWRGTAFLDGIPAKTGFCKTPEEAVESLNKQLSNWC